MSPWEVRAAEEKFSAVFCREWQEFTPHPENRGAKRPKINDDARG